MHISERFLRDDRDICAAIYLKSNVWSIRVEICVPGWFRLTGIRLTYVTLHWPQKVAFGFPFVCCYLVNRRFMHAYFCKVTLHSAGVALLVSGWAISAFVDVISAISACLFFRFWVIDIFVNVIFVGCSFPTVPYLTSLMRVNLVGQASVFSCCFDISSARHICVALAKSKSVSRINLARSVASLMPMTIRSRIKPSRNSP